MRKRFRQAAAAGTIMIQTPRLAAAVILLRSAEPRGFEVFLMRRPCGIYGFPGGAMRKEDYNRAMLNRTAGLTPHRARQILGAHFTPREALGLWVTAIREVFAATGILIAINDANKRASPISGITGRVAEKYSAPPLESLNFQACFEFEKLSCHASALGHYSHWQTTTEESDRCETHFFITALPRDYSHPPKSPLVNDSRWLTPDRALQMYGKGRLPMIFATFASLRTLADFETIESVWKEFCAGSGY